MMKVNFLKRLESSVQSFEITMDRTIAKIEDLRAQDPIAFKSIRDENPEMNDLETRPRHGRGRRGTGRTPLQVGGKFKYSWPTSELDAWLKDLQQDKEQLSTAALRCQGCHPRARRQTRRN